MMEASVRELKGVIEENDGANVAGRAFSRRVDQLISAFYDDIGEISTVRTSTLFDLFVIKVLYVERRSTDAAVLDYLGQLLDRYLYTHELFPQATSGALSLHYLSGLLQETEQRGNVQNLFEAYRKYGDNYLYVTGIFPGAMRRRRGRRGAAVASLNRTTYIANGKRFYRLAAEHDLAEATRLSVLLEKLSAYFEVYMDALSEMSERYIMGFDLNLIADKMLDNFNRFRRSGNERFLENARRYAAILKVSPDSFPSLARRRRTAAHVLRASAP